MTNVEVQEEEIKEIEAMRRTKLSETAIVSVTTAEGNVVTRKVKAAFDFGSGALETNWRVRALANASLLNDNTRVIIDTYHTTTGSSDQLIVPQEMLQTFLSCCDVKVQCGAILLGHALPDAPYIKEVLCLLLPPQTGTANTIRVPSHIPFTSHHITDNNLSFLGYIRVGDTDLQLTSHDVALIGKLVGANTTNTTTTNTTNNNNEEGSMHVDGLMCVIAALSQNEVTIRAYSLTPDGLSWAHQEANNALKKTSTEAASEMYTCSRATISTTTHGFFLVPMERTWNYFFIGAQWNEESEYDVTVDVPLPFFHPLHRVEHFVNFLRLGENEELVDVNDDNDVFEDEDALQTS